MAEKALQLQHQIRENSQELGDFLGDLNKWEKDIKKKDEELKKTDAIDQINAAPIRRAVKKEKKKETQNIKEKEKTEQPKSRISSYDYDAWSKFNVADECEKIDKDEEAVESEESECEEDLEVAQEIVEQRRLQRAVLEKDKGNELFKEGKYEAAINRYTIAVELDPRNAIALANRAMAMLKLERYAAAEEDCNRSLMLDPEYAKAIARRATARTKLKKYQGAIEDQEHLLQLQPNNKQAKNELEKLRKEAAKVKENAATVKQPKRRSNKPLKRIVIEEIGSDDEREVAGAVESPAELPVELLSRRISNNQKSKNLETSVKLKENDAKERIEFQVPSSPVQFETDFQKIKKNIEDFYRYFSVIPPSMYKSLFHHSIDDVLPRALECFHKYYKRDGKEYWDELCNLVQVPRFEMAQMFLSKSSKGVAREVFQELIKKNFPNSEDEILGLAKQYGIALKDS